MEITIEKISKGVHVTYGFSGTRGISIDSSPSRFKVELIDKWSFMFGGLESTGKFQHKLAPSDKVHI
jgi:hypothetical protein